MAITNDEFCYTVMRELGEVAGTNGDPLRNRQPTGLLDALRSTENTSGTEVDRLYDSGDGKTKKVILKHIIPDAVADTATTITDICDDDGTAAAWNYTDVEIGLEVQSAVKKLTADQMRVLCETESEWRMKLIGQMLNSVHKKLNQTLVSPFYAGVGGILGGNGAPGESYEFLFRDTLLQINPEGVMDMMQDLGDTGMVGLPIVVGGGNIKKYADLKGIACCNALGLDVSQVQDFLLYYDNDVDAQLANASENNMFFVFAPGAAQFVDKPFYQGEFRRITDDSIRDTITDPISGLTWDFRAKYDDCTDDGEWTIKLSLHYDVWQLPLTLFKSTDDRYKINYNWAFKATEGS